MIYHITSREEWDEAVKKGFYITKSFEKDGLIQCSSKNQLWLVATFMFQDKKNLVVLCIDEKKVKPKVIFEDLKKHGTFPNIYGKLNLDAVVDVVDFPIDEDGNFFLPKKVQEMES